MAVHRLALLIEGTLAGEVQQLDGGELRLTYDNAWRLGPTATPVSVSMPLRQLQHPDSVVRPFLMGLLPDNERVLERWGRQYHVSSRNPFALLRHVGEDCAGAVQFVAPDRIAKLLAGDGGVEWLDESQVEDRLRILRGDPAAWHQGDMTGQFSLAGAQAKMALHFDPTSHRWGVPWGRVPTTHILKPAVQGLDQHDLNEHLCLSAAQLTGLRAAGSQVVSFGDQRAIVVERYDRTYRSDGQILRVHQEDMCQALGLAPTAKYQNEGGPTPERLIALMQHEILPAPTAAEDVLRFVEALVFNWIIAGTDAHAKNYSLLLSGSQVRLAPLYDIASALPYEDMYLPKLRMAMRVGREYKLESVCGRHWRRLAEVAGLDADNVVAKAKELIARVPKAFADARAVAAVEELGSRLPGQLSRMISARAAWCAKAMER